MTAELQKASLSKRIAAALLDFMLLIIIVTGIVTVLANLFGYKAHIDAMEARQKFFETKYDVVFQITEEDYNKLPAEQREKYDTAVEALFEDEEFLYAYNMQVSLTLLIITAGILLGILVVDFIIPLWLKDGQTMGKKIFGLGLVRIDGVQVTKLQLFIRAILGKFTIETMIPVYIFIMIYFNTANIGSIAILAALLLGQIICMIVTKTNAPIHDLLAGTAVIDVPSQRIFKSKEELLEYTKKIHAERANRSDYK